VVLLVVSCAKQPSLTLLSTEDSVVERRLKSLEAKSDIYRADWKYDLPVGTSMEVSLDQMENGSWWPRGVLTYPSKDGPSSGNLSLEYKFVFSEPSKPTHILMLQTEFKSPRSAFAVPATWFNLTEHPMTTFAPGIIDPQKTGVVQNLWMISATTKSESRDLVRASVRFIKK
jgi:hypothetical protein